VVLQLGVWRGANNPSPYKTNLFRNVSISLGPETWSLTVREGHKLRVFENIVLRRIFFAKEGWSDGRVEKAA
jgi:hypothetical protein